MGCCESYRPKVKLWQVSGAHAEFREHYNYRGADQRAIACRNASNAERY